MAQGKKKKGKKQRRQASAGRQISVNVTVQPSGGKSTSKKVSLPQGATVGEALAAAGASAEGKNVFVGGKPGESSNVLASDADVTVSERASAA